MLARKIERGEILVMKRDSDCVGWLRWGYFWDEIPFANLVWIDEPWRRQGFGRRLVTDWESRMRSDGFDSVMTSSQSDETGQHFFRSLGYVDCGALLLPHQVLEVLFRKTIGE